MQIPFGSFKIPFGDLQILSGGLKLLNGDFQIFHDINPPRKYLEEIKQGDNSASIWKADLLNARGQITGVTFGNRV